MGANPNTLSPSKPTYLSRRMQIKRGKMTIYKEIVNMEEQSTLVKGTAVSRPYRSALVVKTLAADGAYERQAITDTTETLTVDTQNVIAIYVTDVDALQTNYNTKNQYGDDAMKRMDEHLDGDILGEYSSASSVVGAYEVAGTGSASDGLGFTLTTSNILSVFSKVRTKLQRKHIPMNDRWAIISPEFFEVLMQFIAGRESLLGDKVGTNPKEMGTYGGFRLFVSEATGWSARLEMATIATDTDTIVINGATFTADADGAAVGAGHFSIQTTATLCCGQLADAINNSEEYAASVGTVDTYIELTAANRAKLEGITASFTAGDEYLTLKGEGVGYVVVSETLTTTANTWTSTYQIQHNLFGQGKPIDLVVQKYPKIAFKDRSDASFGYIGQDMVVWDLYGLKTFTEGADALVDVQILSGGF
jgi:hypothetical protein